MLTPFDETLAAAGLFLTAEEHTAYSAYLYEGIWGTIKVQLSPRGWVWYGEPTTGGGWASSSGLLNIDDAHRALRRYVSLP